MPRPWNAVYENESDLVVLLSDLSILSVPYEAKLVQKVSKHPGWALE